MLELTDRAAETKAESEGSSVQDGILFWPTFQFKTQAQHSHITTSLSWEGQVSVSVDIPFS